MPGRTKKAAARVPVTRERALRAALAVADAEGLGALTMRRLARAVGVARADLDDGAGTRGHDEIIHQTVNCGNRDEP